jgi:AraC-like DNA-binding protein
VTRTKSREPELEGLSLAPEPLAEDWHVALRRRLVGLDVRSVASPGSFREHDLGDLLVTDWQSPPIEAVRTTRMAEEDEDALIVMTAQAGELAVVLPERTAALRPGSVLLLRSRASGRVAVPRSVIKRSIRLPLHALTPFSGGCRIPDLLAMQADENPVSWLLLDFLAGVDQQQNRLDGAGVEATRRALLSLVAGIIQVSQSAAVPTSDLLSVLRQQMEKWIAEHLSDGVIRVRDLAAAYNVAPRTVHRAFASTGDTLGSVVRSQRIAAARNDLVNSTLSIASIAFRWGYCDASHFGREFRRATAMSPGDYREAFGVV